MKTEIECEEFARESLTNYVNGCECMSREDAVNVLNKMLGVCMEMRTVVIDGKMDVVQ